MAGFRVLQLLPGVGPAAARSVLARLSECHFMFKTLNGTSVPSAAAPHWNQFCAMMGQLHDSAAPWIGQLRLVREWYQPHLERLYDHPTVRVGDLEKLEQISTGYATRERFLTELTLDPPEATGAESGAPLLDEDYLILSTIHSAKGQEWDVVFILNVADGCIPSDMAAGSPGEDKRRTSRSGRRYDACQAAPSFDPASSVFPKSTTSLRRLSHVCAAEPSSVRRPSSISLNAGLRP